VTGHLSGAIERIQSEHLDGSAALRERLAAAEAQLAGVDHKIELARVNADLKLEQAYNLIQSARDMHDEAEQLVGGLRAEMTAVQREKALLVEERKKAASERLEHVGPYKAGEKYRRHHIVMRDGSSYICVTDETTADPREKLADPHWRLFAKAGDRGPQGPQGPKGDRGLQGAKGDPGNPGADGAGLRSVSTSGLAAVLVSSDGEAHRVDFAKAVEALVDKMLKERLK
jgi:hypothetical protein